MPQPAEHRFPFRADPWRGQSRGTHDSHRTSLAADVQFFKTILAAGWLAKSLSEAADSS